MFRIKSAIAGAVWPAIPNSGGAAILAALFQLERSQWWSPEELWRYQRSQLGALLRHAAASSAYYRQSAGRFLEEHTPDFTREEFASLPVLTRDDLQRHHEEVVSAAVPPQHGKVSRTGTSGSTGEPVQFHSTELVNFYWQAFNLRDHLWHGRDFGAKLAAVRVDLKAGTMSNWFGEIGETMLETGPCVLIPAELSTREQARVVIEEDPAYLTSYTNNLVGILEQVDAIGGRLPGLRQARAFGEAVPDEARRYVRERWGVPLIDLYSAREAGYIALQCPAGEGYHVQSEGVYVEILSDDGRACLPGETGRVVVTPLHNFAFPMIRYDLGDHAEVGDPCACGRGLPALRRIYGRARNLMKLRDGTARWPAFGTPQLRLILPIRQFQVIQHGFDDLEVRLVTERPATEGELDALATHICRHLGHPFDIRWTFLDELPRNAGLKFEDFVRAF